MAREELEDDDVIVEDGQENEIPEDDQDGAEDDGDDRAESGNEDDGESGEQDDGESGEQDDGEQSDDEEAERERIRERRRIERQNKKLHRQEREDTMRRELAARDALISELQQQVGAINRRNSGSEVAQIDNELGRANQAYAYYKEQLRIGTEAADGSAVSEATEKMFQIRQRAEELSRIKQALAQRAQQPQPLDPRLVNNAKGWMDKNKWYDPSGKDSDSRVALSVDQQMAEQGWNPTMPEYWSELDSRLKKYLPHRFAMTQNRTQGNKPKSVVSGSGRESASNSTGYKLSADRVSALKEAGMWEDPKLRAEAIKRFREHDKQNRKA